jgi:hypothetical protein
VLGAGGTEIAAGIAWDIGKWNGEYERRIYIWQPE